MMILTRGNPHLDHPDTTPALQNWVRLEVQPQSADLERSLQAVIADPLWLLGRQWQFNEFQGDDGGMPARAWVDLDVGVLDQIRLGHSQASTLPDQPLEATVEAEPVDVTQVGPFGLSLRDAAEAGLQCLRRLESLNLPALAAALRDHYRLPSVTVDAALDPGGDDWLDLFAGRALDGAALARDLILLRGSNDHLNDLGTLRWRAEADVQRDAVLSRLDDWLDEHLACYTSGPANLAAWQTDRQAYAFSIQSRFASNRSAVLWTDAYAEGHLDWSAFSARSGATLAPTSPPEPKTFAPAVPAQIRYPGMAADRFWEFEDSTVVFGQSGAGLTEILRMVLTDYALVHSTDWFAIPLTLEVGRVIQPRKLHVIDTFGVPSRIDPINSTATQPWHLFDLTVPAGDSSLIWMHAPTVVGRLQGEPLEEVAFLRDEPANLVWGVEQRVQSIVTGARDRRREVVGTVSRSNLSEPQTSAEHYFRLQTDVPEYWIPFVPVSSRPPQPADMLQRSALTHPTQAGIPAEINPVGLVLRTNPPVSPEHAEPALNIREDEIPREGMTIRRAFQYARGPKGQSYLWLGRERQPGRGEGASGLRFDALLPTPT